MADNSGGANSFNIENLQTMENETASSILEFFVKQRVIPDNVANHISPNLNKAILIRLLASELALRSVSEKTLDILELIEELDRKNGFSSPCDSMKAAYCAVALACTSAALRLNLDTFLDSFHRIWVIRICEIEVSAAGGLISEELREVRDIVWEAVKNPEVRVLVVDIDLEETLGLLRNYLEEVWDREHLFSGVAAIDEIEGVEREQDLISSNLDMQRMVQDIFLDPGNKATKLLVDNSETCSEKFERNNGETKKDKLISGSEISTKVTGTEGKQTDVDDEQALKVSYLDLRRTLQNTLLDAANKAIKLQAVNPEEACNEKSRVNDDQNRRDELTSSSKIDTEGASIEGNEASGMLNNYLIPSCLKEKKDNQNVFDVHELMGSLKKVPDTTPDDENGTQKDSKKAYLPTVNLMERNPTAQTFEWTDSPPREERVHLHSPKRGHASPLKFIDHRRYAKRRKKKKWTLLEEETLLKAVRDHGRGNWKAILSEYPNIFEARTEVDLKDKWRNMTRSNWSS